MPVTSLGTFPVARGAAARVFTGTYDSLRLADPDPDSRLDRFEMDGPLEAAAVLALWVRLVKRDEFAWPPRDSPLASFKGPNRSIPADLPVSPACTPMR